MPDCDICGEHAVSMRFDGETPIFKCIIHVDGRGEVAPPIKRPCRTCGAEGEVAGWDEIPATTRSRARQEFYYSCDSHLPAISGDNQKGGDNMVKFEVLKGGGGGGGTRTPFMNGKALSTLGGVGDTFTLDIKGWRWKPLDANAKFPKPPIPGPPVGPADQTVVIDAHAKGPRGEGDYTVILSKDSFNVFVLGLGDDADRWAGKSVPGIILPAPGGSLYARYLKDLSYWQEQDAYWAGVKGGANGQAQKAPVAPASASTPPPAPPPPQPSPDDVLAKAERMLAEAKARQEAAEAKERALQPLPVEAPPKAKKAKGKK